MTTAVRGFEARRVAITCVVMVAWVATGGHAQVTGQLPSTFRSGVDVVLVDVSVLDRDRRSVRGLTAADFTILEDGKPRPVVAFTAFDLPRATPLPAGWMGEVAADITTNASPQEGRLVTILLDRTVRPPFQATARRLAEATIAALGPDDRAAVIYSGAEVPQGFTADRELLRAAVRRPFRSLSNDDGGNPGDCYCGICSVDAMTRAADAVRDVPQRRKTLLFIGDTIGVVNWSYDAPITVDCRPAIKDARERLTRAVQVANVTVHAIDPRGLETGAVGADTAVAASETGKAVADAARRLSGRLDDLRVLADIGGGRAVLNTNAPDQMIAAVLAETSSYYVLAFQPADTRRDGRLHPIRVTVDRPGLKAQARQGHFGPGPQVETSPDSKQALADMVTGIMPKIGLGLSVVAAPFAVKDKAEAAVVFAVGIHETAEQRARTAAAADRVEVFTNAFDSEGRSAASVLQTIRIPDPPGGDDRTYDVIGRLDLKPGRYELRIAARHGGADRAGSVYAFVDVPDFRGEGLTMSGLLLEAAAPRITPPDVLGDLVPVLPVSRREFNRTDPVSAFVRVYQGGDGPARAVALRVLVVDSGSRPVFERSVTLEPEDFAAGAAADGRLDLPLDRFAPGEYLLTIEAARGTATTRRDARFQVR